LPVTVRVTSFDALEHRNVVRIVVPDGAWVGMGGNHNHQKKRTHARVVSEGPRILLGNQAEQRHASMIAEPCEPLVILAF